MWSRTISESEEGDSARRRRGNIPVRKLAVRGDGGELLEVVHGPHEGAVDHRLHIVREIEGHGFDICPICLAPDPSSAEHLPPAALGGRTTTRTCTPCNNDLGRLEAELFDWRDDALRHTTATSEAIVGARKLPRLLHRETPDGKFALIVDGPIHPHAEPVLKRPGFALRFVPPNPRLYKLAAFKHAYLAACLDLRAIPQTPRADVIRRDLLAARDARSRRKIPASEYALSMPVMRTHEQPRGPSVALGYVRQPDGSAECWIALAGTWRCRGRCPTRRRPSDGRRVHHRDTAPDGLRPTWRQRSLGRGCGGPKGCGPSLTAVECAFRVLGLRSSGGTRP